MKGFTILEVMIATAIASMLSVSLFVALRQTMGYQVASDRIIDAYSRAAILQSQLEQDFMGFFVPKEAYELVQTKTGTQAAGKKTPEQIDKIFFGEKGKESGFALMSFISTHAMQVYWGQTVGEPKPLVTRVVYRLVENKKEFKTEETSYRLQRQESYNLNFALFEDASKVRAYDIVNDIKEMKVTYIARVYPSTSSQASPKATPSRQPEAKEEVQNKNTWTYKEFTEWDWSPKKAKVKKPDEKGKVEESLGQKEKVSRVPFYIKVNVVLWDVGYTRTIPFEFVFARKPFEVEELETDEPPAKPEAQQPQMPNLKPVLDILKIPTAAAQPKPASPVPIAQNKKPAPIFNQPQWSTTTIGNTKINVMKSP